MKFLVTNDDGIEAPGLAMLEQALSGLGKVVVVAPHNPLSGCSHQVSTNRPLQVTEIAAGWHAVDGMPADCIRLGLLHLAPDADWVMAGVNDGANLGVDVYMSGTVAAAREAALFGKPGIAYSQYRRTREPVAWSATVPMVKRVVERLQELPLEPGAFWNVNFPDPHTRDETPDIVFCPLDSSHLPVRYEIQNGRFYYRGVYQERPHKQGADVDVCFSGQIAVTQILPSEPG